MKAAKAGSWKRVGDVSAAQLQAMTLAHPLNASGYAYDVPMLAGSHVSDDTGTGFVHTAPSHGEDDYEVWMANAKALAARGIDTTIPNTVDAFGRYTNVCPGFEGLEIIELEGKKRGQDGPANKAVMDKLIEAGALLARGVTTLRDAHSWRSKAPVIRRGTPQWFIAMDQKLSHLKGKEGKTLRELCLEAIDATTFTPERGRERIRVDGGGAAGLADLAPARVGRAADAVRQSRDGRDPEGRGRERAHRRGRQQERRGCVVRRRGGELPRQ